MYKIEVKKIDIKKGSCQAPQSCAVARAFLRAGFDFPGWNDGVSDRWVDAVNPQGIRISQLLPVRVQKWIKKFDADKKSVKPFSFNFRG